MKKFKRYLVTSALPYANGPVHIGHLAGVYIPSDIYVRYLRLRGEDVVSVCGSDEHGVPITIKARQEGVTPQDIVDKYHNIIKNAFKGLGISFDIYSRTTSPVHHKTASDFFRTLYDKGEFTEKTDDAVLRRGGRTVSGRPLHRWAPAPTAATTRAYGDQCEKCGQHAERHRPDRPAQRDHRFAFRCCARRRTGSCRSTSTRLSCASGFSKGTRSGKSNVYGQCKSWLDLGLQPRAVSRDLDWGIPVPVEGAEGKVLYVWFDAPIGYISATKELTPDWEKYWKDAGDQDGALHRQGQHRFPLYRLPGDAAAPTADTSCPRTCRPTSS